MTCEIEKDSKNIVNYNHKALAMYIDFSQFIEKVNWKNKVNAEQTKPDTVGVSNC